MNKHGEHGELGTLYFDGGILFRACKNTDCAFNTFYYKNIYRNGCSMLSNIDSCVSGQKSGFISIEDAKKKGLVPEDFA